MRIDAQWGSDTGMYLVDVYLESHRACVLMHREIGAGFARCSPPKGFTSMTWWTAFCAGETRRATG